MTAVRFQFARSLRGKLIILFVAAGLVPLSVIGVISYRQAAGEMHRSAGARLADVAFNATDKIDRNLFERYGDVQAFAKSDAARSMDPTRLSSWMNTMMATYTPIYQLMVVADSTGNVIAANSVDLAGRPLDTSALSGLNVGSASWFRQAIGGRLRDGETLVDDLHRDSLMEKVYGDGASSYAMSFTYPIRDDGGQIVGVWTNRFNWPVVEDILGAARQRAQEHGMRTLRLTLVNRRGTVLSGGRAGDVLVRSVAGSPVVRRALSVGASGYAEGGRLHENGSRQLQGYFHSAGYSTYPGTGWSVIASQDVSEALAAAAALRTRTLVVALLAALLLGVCAFVVARRLSRPLEELVVASEAAATGDLTVRASAATRRDELGRLARAFDAMIENLAQLVGRISGTSVTLSGSAEDVASNSGQVGTAIEGIARAVGDVAQGAERQVRLLDDARRSAEEMGATVHESARRAQESAAAADEARTATEEGVAAAERATEAVQGVRDSSALVSRAIGELAAKSEQIGGIVETITGIAGQTNLLALNAAIEAARAGDHGRGFAVVAEEVRKLAEEARRAAELIAELVEQTQGETRRVVEVVSEGVRRTEEGAATVEAARIAFLQIGRSVDDASGRAAEIAAAAQQLSADAARVQQGMAEVAGVAEQSSASTQEVSASTQQTSATMQAISASAHELATTADELAQLVGRFTLAA